ncbi:MAG: purine-nucleoside phosphorylase [Anaerolineae bacterium]|nr:purine-nucleoside phosphorylase [Anaerolineae bacterium]
MKSFGRVEFETAAEAIRRQMHYAPRVGIVLGSGIGNIADRVENADIIPYAQIPHWPCSTVIGHQGQLHIGKMEGQEVIVMRGRAHYYEGYPMSQVTLPIRVMQLLGVDIIILTNAAGGINPILHPTDLMLITDHIGLIGMTGANPLYGPNDDTLGPRFLDLSNVYDPALRSMALESAREAGVPLHQGVYICLSGPSFETPAEVRFLRLIGADAVGMSTVPEAIVARHGGSRVLGISGITNIAIQQEPVSEKTTHEEVLETGELIVPRLEAVLRGVLRALANREY